MPGLFRHAVASFEPTESSVIIWTRLSGATEATWLISRDPHLVDVVASGRATTGAHCDHTLVVDVEGLDPGTTYFYRFDSGNECSPVGRTRTLPSAPVESLRIGLVSCSRFSVAPLGVYRAVAEREVDFVIHLGDYIYEDDGTAGSRHHRPARTAVTIDDYRERLAQMREDTDCQALHLRHPMVLVVDDHDVADNCWSHSAKGHDEALHGPYQQRVRAATMARQEWVPARLRDDAEPSVTYRSIPVGDLAEILILDTRLTGRDRQAGDDGTKSLEDPGRSLLGDDQRTWLDGRLADVTRPWAIVVSGVVVNEISLPLPGISFLNPLLPSGYAAIEGKVIHDDQWDGYPKERDHMIAQMEKRKEGGGRSLVLSGDVHSSWAFEGPRCPDGDAVAVEVTTPAVASKPMGRSRMPGAWRILDGLMRHLEHARWVDVSHRGYSVVDVTPDVVTAEWWFVEATDIDPTKGAERARTLRSDRATWPPRWEEGKAMRDPARPTLSAPPPPRPDDLVHMRRVHHMRQGFARASGLVVMAGVAAMATTPARRRLTRRFLPRQ